MKLTDKQALLLFELVKDSLKIRDAGIFSFDINARGQLVNDIINQQNDQMVDLSKENSTVHIPRLSENKLK